MERRMKVQDVVKALQQGGQSVQDDEVVIIERDKGPDLVIMTRAEFERLQAGQRNPDAVPAEPTGGQRNPDTIPSEMTSGQRNPD